jgi:hypothetical protein
MKSMKSSLLPVLGMASYLILPESLAQPSGYSSQQELEYQIPGYPSRQEPEYQPPNRSGSPPQAPSQSMDRSSTQSSGAYSVPQSSGASSVGAEEQTQLNLPPPVPMKEVAPITKDGVTYLCGGVGEEETARMKSDARDYDLMLTFAERNGSYLANVSVDIADARGNSVLQATCDAPIMLVDLPKNGTYRVRAEAEGYSVARTAQVHVTGRTRSRVLVWPSQAGDMGQASRLSGGS